MRNKFVKLKATEDEQREWMAHAKRSGRTLSEMIRSYMEGRIAREAKKDAAKVAAE